ncbi:MAG: hypothetical protein LH481_15495 [Burkholderiales bacterium]|nr:hypothetical protein [Burkholderiales bacterium]
MSETNAPPKIYRLMETRSDARGAIADVLQMARREIRIFDADPKLLKERDLGKPARIELLRNLLLAGRDHKLRIALHDTRGIESELPRLMDLLTQFSGQIQIHRTSGRASEARDSMIIADEAHFWRKLHVDHPRSVLTLHDATDTRPLLDRFEEIWEQSELAVTGSRLGL